KATLAPPADAQRSSGYVTGGISPVGQRTPLPTVIDASAAGLDRVYVSGGRRGLDVALAPRDLAVLTGATRAPVAARRWPPGSGRERPVRVDDLPPKRGERDRDQLEVRPRQR